MIKILDINEKNILGFRFDGKVETSDIDRVWEALEAKLETNEKVRIYAEAGEWNLSDMSIEAAVEDFQLWLKNPGFITRIEKAALVTDLKWLKALFDVECSLIPSMEGSVFSSEQKDEALEWIKSEREETGELNIKLTELVEIGLLRFMAGIGVGLLAADLIKGRKRKAVGSSLFLGSVIVGAPLGIKFFKKNKGAFCQQTNAEQIEAKTRH